MNTLNLENNNTKDDTNMQPAYIEQMLMWMTIFVSFVWLFFLIINYSTAVRLSDNMDAMSKYAAKYVSALISQTNAVVTNDQTLIDSLNDIKLTSISQINQGDISCVVATAAPENTNSQSIFTIRGTFNKGFLSGQGVNNMISKSVVYNQNNAAQISCTLDITINN